MNKDTLTPSRLSDDCVALFESTNDNHRLKWRPWLTEPVENGSETPFQLRRTDIDAFQHVNNSIYWHGVHEVLGHVPDIEKAPHRAVLEYRKPIKFGESVVLRWLNLGDTVRMHFVVGDEVRAAARVARI